MHNLTGTNMDAATNTTAHNRVWTIHFEVHNSTDGYLSTTEPNSPASDSGMAPARLLYLVGLPSIMLLGLIGNTLSFVTSVRPVFLKKATYFYLSCLALSDSCLLVIYGAIRFTATLMAIRLNAFMCSVGNFIYYFSSHLSAWLLVAMTIDRFLHIVFPQKRHKWCTRRRAHRVCILLCVLLFLLDGHNIFTHQPSDMEGDLLCAARPWAMHFAYNLWPVIDAIIYCFLPSAVLFILNSLIIYWIQREPPLITLQYSVLASEARRVTVTLLIVSSVFLVCSLPVVTITILVRFRGQTVYSAIDMTLIDLTFYVNHACNFFIFCCSSKNFRREVMAAVIRRQNIVTPQTSSSDNVELHWHYVIEVSRYR